MFVAVWQIKAMTVQDNSHAYRKEPPHDMQRSRTAGDALYQ